MIFTEVHMDFGVFESLLVLFAVKGGDDGAECGLSKCIFSNTATLKLLLQVDMMSVSRRLRLFSHLLFNQKSPEKDTVKESNLSKHDSQLEQFYYHWRVKQNLGT